MSTTKISPFVATLLTINSMIGAGLFINPQPLTALAGSLGWAGYFVSACILFPLILSIAELARRHPVHGGLYVYSKQALSPFAGFIAGWGYFIGKTASIALLLYKTSQFFQSIIPALVRINTTLLASLLIFLLILLNLAGVSIGGKVQYFFTGLKTIPVLFTIGAGIYLFNPSFFSWDAQLAARALLAIPIAAFPLLGFEVICSIAHLIKDAEHNVKRVIVNAFLIVACIDISFQFFIFGALGNALAHSEQPLLYLAQTVFTHHPVIAHMLNSMVFIAIFGTCFSLLSSNCWNLYTLADNNHIPGKQLLTRVTRNSVPWVSTTIQGLLGVCILIITHNQIALQNMSVFAQSITFFLSALAAYVTLRNDTQRTMHPVIPALGAASACLIIILCLNKIMQSGVSLPFLSIFMTGIVIATIKIMGSRLKN